MADWTAFTGYMEPIVAARIMKSALENRGERFAPYVTPERIAPLFKNFPTSIADDKIGLARTLGLKVIREFEEQFPLIPD